MPQPNSPNITSTPAQSYQPYSAENPGSTSPWVKLEENSGPVDIHSGRVNGEFENSAPWAQV